MQHFGDITQLNGANIPPVNVIIGGSPCQDLSIAGKRAGLAGARSGLFMEQIRVIKEMRDADAIRGRTGRDIRPRFMVWENVIGAFSSNGGEDFKAVLEETIRIVKPDAPDVPLPKRGKWPMADAYFGNGWSLAYRVLDAQFWGVPQRRRRIALVADFGGQSAPEILFEREGVSGYSQKSRTAWKRTAAYAGSGIAGNDCAVSGGVIQCANPWDPQSERVFVGDGTWHSLSSNSGGGQSRDAILVNDGSSEVARSLTARHDGSSCLDRGENIVVQSAGFSFGQSAKAHGIGYQEEVSPTIRGGEGGNQKPYVVCMATQQGGAEIREDDMAPTLTAAAGTSGNNQPVICIQGNCIDRADTAGCNGKGWTEDVSYTLNTIDRPAVAIALNNHPQDSRITIAEDGIVQTLNGQMGTGGNNTPMVMQAVDSGAIAAFQNTGRGWWNESDVAATLRTACDGDATKANLIASVDCRNGAESPDVNGTLQAKSTGGQSLNLNNVVRCGYIVRRLTPLECERLQGFPDGWTQIGKLIDYVTEYDESGDEYRLAVYEYTDEDGKRHKVTDSSRYKALGNSIAIPPWFYVLQRLSIACGVDKTMASLFDGIGGFPLIWEGLHGKGSCLWASEIEAFPIAVTQQHFGELHETEGE